MVPDPGEPAGDVEILSAEDLTGSGLLWKINHDLLHRLGLALVVREAGPSGEVQLALWRASEPFEFEQPVNEARAAAFAEWQQRNQCPAT